MPTLPNVGQVNWGPTLNDWLKTLGNSSTGGFYIANTSTDLSSSPYDTLPDGTSVFVKDEIKLYKKETGSYVEKIDFAATVTSSSAPSSPSLGDTYYNTGDNKLYYWNGTSWVEVGGATGAQYINDLLDAKTDTTSVFLGSGSGNSDDGGNYNAAVGYEALLSNTSGIDNTAVGHQALRSNTTGSSNTAVGDYALRTNTTGNYNTAVGDYALRLNTTGYNNTALGYVSLRSNTAGYDNTAVGYSSLYANTTGYSNTAIGYNSLHFNVGNLNTAIGHWTLYENTSGLYNVAVGADALANNTTAYYNTAVGTWALTANVTGWNNTALGYSALNDNTGGSNTAVGSDALSQNTTGSFNTAVGVDALYLNAASNDNTAIGYNALRTNQTGYSNTAAGFKAGNYIADGITSNQASAQSIYLGADTKALANGDTNEIVIGYNTTGNGSNTVTLGNSSITNVKTAGTLTLGAITLPNTDGTNGQVLKTNGSGAVSWQNDAGASATVFESVSSDTLIREASNTNQYNRDFIVGSPQLADDGNAAHDSRMFFDKSKGAFRAGTATGTQWDDANVGINSVAFGSGATASGAVSFAMGGGAQANGDLSFVFGEGRANSGSVVFSSSNCSADGFGSFSFGAEVHNDGEGSIGMGAECYSSVDYGFASGGSVHPHLYGSFSRTVWNNYSDFNTEAQYNIVSGWAETNGAVTEEIFLNSDKTERMTLIDDSLYGFTIKVIAKGSTSNAFYEYKGLIKNDGTTTSILGSIQENIIYEEDAGLNVSVTADNANDSLKVSVTGIAGQITRWYMKAELIEIGDI